jgi:HEPN domain-containing protein
MRPETQLWLEDAEYDLESAKAMLESGRYFFVVFMCHLTIEKLLKAAIVERQGVEPPKVHNLVLIATKGGVDIPQDHRPIVNDLDGMSVVTRYPDGRRSLAATLTAERADGIYKKTEDFSQWLRQELISSQQ